MTDTRLAPKTPRAGNAADAELIGPSVRGDSAGASTGA